MGKSTHKVLPLATTHERAGAFLTSVDGWQLPARYSDAQLEYSDGKYKAALIDKSQTGRVRITGNDALDLLNRLSTNKLDNLKPGECAQTILTSNKGRIIDLLLVSQMDDSITIVTSPDTATKVIDWIDFYTFGEDIKVEDISQETALLSIVGPEPYASIDNVIPTLDPDQNIKTVVSGIEVEIFRTNLLGLSNISILSDASKVSGLWEYFINAGLRPMGEEASEMLRLEHGIPRYGRELGEAFNPLEAGLISCINFEKGCYTGQEVVLRLKTYNKIQKHLSGIVTKEGKPAIDARLEIDGKDVGHITSVAPSPVLGENLALGYVKSGYCEPDQKLVIRTKTESSQGRVVQLPL